MNDKSKKCKTTGCNHLANPDTGYCPACEAEWRQFGRDIANWISLRDAAIKLGWARPEK